MKTLLISIYSLLVLAFKPEKPPIDKDNCSINGKKLYGTVKVVDVQLEADFIVFVVDNFADVDVKKVDYVPTSCGEWRFVDYYS
ncbi:MAG: hypothetical protein LBH82_04135, partial [Bacteroidales bacterium]|nr:hypothetical protein [Bacteroidales bacterium]